MAYNPAIYNSYTSPYAGSYGQPNIPVQQPQSYAPQMQAKGEIEWVDGEVGAKAYQIPAGTTKPVALWDTNDCVIYLKSMNPMGMPNPLQKIHYTMEDSVPKYMGQDQAKLASGEEKPDYVRRDELDKMKEELLTAIREASVQETGKHATKGE